MTALAPSVFPFMSAFTPMHQEKRWARLLLSPQPALSSLTRTGSSLFALGPGPGLQCPFLALAAALGPVEHGNVLGEAFYSFADSPRRLVLLCHASSKTPAAARSQHSPCPGVCTPAHPRAGQPALLLPPLPDIPPPSPAPHFLILTLGLSDEFRICSRSSSSPAPWKPCQNMLFSSVSSLCLLLCASWTSSQCQGEDRALLKEPLSLLHQAQGNRMRSSKAKQGCSVKQPSSA